MGQISSVDDEVFVVGIRRIFIVSHGIGWTFMLSDARGCNYILELCDFILLFSVTTFPEPFSVLPCLDLLTFFLYYT